MVNPRQVIHAVVLALLLSLLPAASVSLAYGQQPDFTLAVVPDELDPPAVNPGGTAIGTIDLGAVNGFDSTVSLSCTLAPGGPATTSPPVCTPSPDPANPPDKPSLTVKTSENTPTGTYQFIVTGTSGSITHFATVTLGVTPLIEDYTLSVLPTTATPSPVAAGLTATTIVTVTPIGSYGNSSPAHQVTLSCLSVTPVVIGSPTCSFSPAAVAITGGVAPTATLTITTYGTATTTKNLSHPRTFYALWLALPGLALVAAGGAGNRWKRLLGLLLLLAVAGGLLLLPACNSINNTNSPTGQITPNNTYTFTLTGADENGAAPSNTTTGTGAATVTLQVTAH
jgi:hypothetical protein